MSMSALTKSVIRIRFWFFFLFRIRNTAFNIIDASIYLSLNVLSYENLFFKPEVDRLK